MKNALPLVAVAALLYIISRNKDKGVSGWYTGRRNYIRERGENKIASFGIKRDEYGQFSGTFKPKTKFRPYR